MASPRELQTARFKIVEEAVKDPRFVERHYLAFKKLHDWIKGQTTPAPWNGPDFLAAAEPVVSAFIGEMSLPRLSDASVTPPPSTDAASTITDLQAIMLPSNFTFAHEEESSDTEAPKP